MSCIWNFECHYCQKQKENTLQKEKQSRGQTEPTLTQRHVVYSSIQRWVYANPTANSSWNADLLTTFIIFLVGFLKTLNAEYPPILGEPFQRNLELRWYSMAPPAAIRWFAVVSALMLCHLITTSTAIYCDEDDCYDLLGSAPLLSLIIFPVLPKLPLSWSHIYLTFSPSSLGLRRARILRRSRKLITSSPWNSESAPFFPL